MFNEEYNKKKSPNKKKKKKKNYIHISNDLCIFSA